MFTWISAKTAPYIATALLFLAMIAAGNWALSERDKRVVAQQQLAQLQKSLRDAQTKAEAQKKELEDAMQQRVEESRTQARIEAADNERRLRAAVAAQRADADSLRDQLRAAHRRAGEASGDPAAACDDQAAATGDVLAEALRVQAEATAAAEGHAAEVRSLLDAWPRSGAPYDGP